MPRLFGEPNDLVHRETMGGGAPVSDEAVESLPYPQTPPGIARLDHLPTVEASIRYWEAVRVRAMRSHDHDLEWTALGLRLSYEAARQVHLESSPTQPWRPPDRKVVRHG
jgi:hypothetical protein